MSAKTNAKKRHIYIYAEDFMLGIPQGDERTYQI